MHRTELRRLPHACLLMTLLSLSGCGGGGGDSSAAATPPTSKPPPATEPPPETPRTGTAPTPQPGQFLVFQDSTQSFYKYDLDSDTVSRLWGAPGPTVVAGESAISPDGQWIAFTYYQGAELSDVWVMANDGSGLTRVGAPPAGGDGASGFVWSPDSSKLAYFKHVPFIESDSGTEQTYPEVWLVERDGSNRRKLSAAVADPNQADDIDGLQWSPDGRFVSWRLIDAPDWVTDVEWTPYAIELHDVQAGGANRRRIPAPAGVSEPTLREYEWAPDSSRLAFSARASGGFHVFTVKPDGTEVTQVGPSLPVGFEISGFRWSPDSSRLACLGKSEQALELYSVAPDGTALVKLNAPLSADTQVDHHIVWAPDGSRLAYAVNGIRYGTVPAALYSVRPDGTDRVRLNPPPASNVLIDLFKWSADSAWLAYRLGSQFDDRKLYVVRADGSDHVEVNGRLAADPIPDKGYYSPLSAHFGWSPVGASLFHIAEHGAAGSPAELFTLQVDGQVYAKLNDPVVAPVSLEFATFVWSKDGSRIAYVVDDDGDQQQDLFLVAPNGAAYQNISKAAGLSGVKLVRAAK